MHYPKRPFDYPYYPYTPHYHQGWYTPYPTPYPTPWEYPYEEENIEELEEMVEQLFKISTYCFEKIIQR